MELMSQTVLVTGGTGNLGQLLVRQLMQTGMRVRVVSRRQPPPDDSSVEWCVGDLSTGEGLEQALDGVASVAHCATDGRSRDGDVKAARHLLNAAGRVGHPHIVYVSIIGVDRHPLTYYRAKYDTEQLIEQSTLPWTIMRASQFHDMLHFALHEAARLPVMPVLARTCFQTVDTAYVASRMTELIGTGPAGRVADLPGPQTLSMAEMARLYLHSAGRKRLVVPVMLPGRVPSAYRQGMHLAPKASHVGSCTFGEYLSAHPEVKIPAAVRR
jgi:uncharacterized protein YbjT (DUF2867 family)